METLQLQYAQLVDILEEHVHGMEDTEKEVNGSKKGKEINIFSQASFTNLNNIF